MHRLQDLENEHVIERRAAAFAAVGARDGLQRCSKDRNHDARHLNQSALYPVRNLLLGAHVALLVPLLIE
jgi:hypothetical protein